MADVCVYVVGRASDWSYGCDQSRRGRLGGHKTHNLKMNTSSHADLTLADPERLIHTMKMQCSNRLFLIPFAAKHALDRLRDNAVHHVTEHQRTFWTHEAFYIDAELRVLNEMLRTSGDLLTRGSDGSPGALDALAATALTFECLQTLDALRRHKQQRLEAYFAACDDVHRAHARAQTFLRQNYVDEEFLLTTVLKNT